jgi:hypothetical protein
MLTTTVQARSCPLKVEAIRRSTFGQAVIPQHDVRLHWGSSRNYGLILVNFCFRLRLQPDVSARYAYCFLE